MGLKELKNYKKIFFIPCQNTNGEKIVGNIIKEYNEDEDKTPFHVSIVAKNYEELTYYKQNIQAILVSLKEKFEKQGVEDIYGKKIDVYSFDKPAEVSVIYYKLHSGTPEIEKIKGQVILRVPGETGHQGETGPQGATGETGPQGATGETGKGVKYKINRYDLSVLDSVQLGNNVNINSKNLLPAIETMFVNINNNINKYYKFVYNEEKDANSELPYDQYASTDRGDFEEFKAQNFATRQGTRAKALFGFGMKKGGKTKKRLKRKMRSSKNKAKKTGRKSRKRSSKKK